MGLNNSNGKLNDYKSIFFTATPWREGNMYHKRDLVIKVVGITGIDVPEG